MSSASNREERTSNAPGNRRGTTATNRRRRGDLFDPACPTRRLLDRVGSKWVAMIVIRLAEDGGAERRFAELERSMPGVSHKMLSQELQRLAGDGLVRRRVDESVPPKVYYRLTPLGRSLHGPISTLREWAEAHMDEIDSGT